MSEGFGEACVSQLWRISMGDKGFWSEGFGAVCVS